MLIMNIYLITLLGLTFLQEKCVGQNGVDKVQRHFIPRYEPKVPYDYEEQDRLQGLSHVSPDSGTQVHLGLLYMGQAYDPKHAS
jgi:hypothetical protein